MINSTMRFIFNSHSLLQRSIFIWKASKNQDHKGWLAMSRRNIPIANNPSSASSTLSCWSFVAHDDPDDHFLAEALLLRARRSDRIEEEDFETFQDLVAGKPLHSYLAKGEIFVTPYSRDFERYREKFRRDIFAVTSRGDGRLHSIGWKTYAWVIRSVEHGTSDVRILRENVDWTTGSIGSPEREAVEWWER